MTAFRIITGVLIWLGLVAGGWVALDRNVLSQESGGKIVPALWDYATGQRRYVRLEFDDYYWVRIGDPIFVQDGDRFEKIGVLVSVLSDDGPILGTAAKTGAWATAAEAMLYDNAPAVHADTPVTFYEQATSVAWIIRTMLPPGKRQLVMDEIRTTVDLHSDEIVASLRPIVEQTLRDALAAVQQALPPAIAAHREQLQTLGARYQEELIEKEIVPLVKKEIFPIAQEHATPVASRIGRKIWERVSVLRLGSRFLWDKLPGTRGDSLEKEWNRLLRDDAMPVIEAHGDELVQMVKDIMTDAAKNKKVQETLRRAFGHVVEDRELHALIGAIFRKAVVENEALHEALKENWRSQEAQAAIQLAGARLEPAVVRIGNMIFGTRTTGITPEFAMVLRNRLLVKDKRWFVIDGPAAPAQAAGDSREPVTLKVITGGGSDGSPFDPPRADEAP